MTSGDWRALIEAYLNGRLSAEAFMRRFVDAWRNSGSPVPNAIAALQSHVEAFEALLARIRPHLGDRLYLALVPRYDGFDQKTFLRQAAAHIVGSRQIVFNQQDSIGQHSLPE